MSAFDRLTDPYSDRRILTDHDRDKLHDQYRMQLGRNSEDQFHALTEQQLREQAIGKEGFAGTRIRAHYADPNDVQGMTADELNREVDLSSKDARLKALGNMRQNADPMNTDGNAMCGASSLVGAALYGGGNTGIKALVADMIADHAKEKLKDKDAKAPWMDDDFKKIIAKLNDPNAKLTQGELQEVQKKTYEHFQQENLVGKNGVDPNDPANGGLVGAKLNDFVARHPDMQKMFKDNDMGLDSIDLAGTGHGGHLVLGIGHHHDLSGAGGGETRDMIFDPQARQDKRDWGDFMGSDHIRSLELDAHKQLQGEWDDLSKKELTGAAYEREYDKLKDKERSLVYAQQWKFKSDSQLVTDQHELNDYRKATAYEADGDKKIKPMHSQTKPEQDSPFDWMFQ